MLVSHRKKFIFTKTLKTAGSSVEAYFEPYCRPENESWEVGVNCDEYVGESGIVGCRGKKSHTYKVYFNHMKARLIRDKLGKKIWNSYFKFCTIRNPFDKVVSAFHYQDRRFQRDTSSPFPRSKNLKNRGKGFAEALEGKSDVERFRTWIEWGGAESSLDRDKYVIRGKVCLDFFIRLENLQNDLNTVCEKIDVPYEIDTLLSLKSRSRPKAIPLKDYYDDSTIRAVSDLFKFELDYFGYQPPK